MKSKIIAGSGFTCRKIQCFCGTVANQETVYEQEVQSCSWCRVKNVYSHAITKTFMNLRREVMKSGGCRAWKRRRA